LRRTKVKWPLFWLAVFAVSLADIVYRFTMLRPHPLSVGLTTLVLSFLIERPSRRSCLAVFAISAVFAWIHILLCWIAVLVLGAVVLFKLIFHDGFDWRHTLATLAGLAIGAAARPNPLGTLNLAYIPLVKLLVAKQSSLPIRFGIELRPFVWY